MGRCVACGNTGQVSSIFDGMRPCSRCRADAFRQWADDRASEVLSEVAMRWRTAGAIAESEKADG